MNDCLISEGDTVSSRETSVACRRMSAMALSRKAPISLGDLAGLPSPSFGRDLRVRELDERWRRFRAGPSSWNRKVRA